jgi:hypothetical protein
MEIGALQRPRHWLHPNELHASAIQIAGVKAKLPLLSPAISWGAILHATIILDHTIGILVKIAKKLALDRRCVISCQ